MLISVAQSQEKRKALKGKISPSKAIIISDKDETLISDFATNLDRFEDAMEKEILSEVEQMFSFSQKQTIPSNEALQALEKKMQQHTEIAKQSILMSTLPQKHFHE
jgi:hypothetical protein